MPRRPPPTNKPRPAGPLRRRPIPPPSAISRVTPNGNDPWRHPTAAANRPAQGFLLRLKSISSNPVHGVFRAASRPAVDGAFQGTHNLRSVVLRPAAQAKGSPIIVERTSMEREKLLIFLLISFESSFVAMPAAQAQGKTKVDDIW